MLPNSAQGAVAIAAILMLLLAVCDADASEYSRHHPVPPAAAPRTDAVLDMPMLGLDPRPVTSYCRLHPCPPAIVPTDLFGDLDAAVSAASETTQVDRDVAAFVRHLDDSSGAAFRDFAK